MQEDSEKSEYFKINTQWIQKESACRCTYYEIYIIN